MLKTYLYVPDKLNEEVEVIARLEKKSKAEVIRTALGEGIRVMKGKRNNSASALLEIVKIAKKHKVKGPKDMSANMDRYLWDNYKV